MVVPRRVPQLKVDPAAGRLRAVAPAELGSPSSWSMVFDPSGAWALAAAQIGGEVVVYAVDRDTGRLRRTGQMLPVTSPSCVRWV